MVNQWRPRVGATSKAWWQVSWPDPMWADDTSQWAAVPGPVPLPVISSTTSKCISSWPRPEPLLWTGCYSDASDLNDWTRRQTEITPRQQLAAVRSTRNVCGAATQRWGARQGMGTGPGAAAHWEAQPPVVAQGAAAALRTRPLPQPTVSSLVVESSSFFQVRSTRPQADSAGQP